MFAESFYPVNGEPERQNHPRGALILGFRAGAFCAPAREKARPPGISARFRFGGAVRERLICTILEWRTLFESGKFTRNIKL